MTLLLMPKATAVWLVDNTTLTFRQIADFCTLHELEVNGIADGEVAQGMKGFDPVVNNQLTMQEIRRCEGDPTARLRLKPNKAAEGEETRRGPRYTPLSKRQDRPAAIAWLVKFHPELADNQISKLVGTTKPTIQSIRDRSHWNMANIQPVDPVALGMCKQTELDAAVAKAAARKAASQETTMSAEDRIRIMETSVSLKAPTEPRLPSSVSGFENFSLSDMTSDPRGEEEENPSALVDADSLFDLPKTAPEDSEDDQPR
ncbi:MAG: cell cycle transcriptional regulator TrcR [Pseudomonadota bacterium]